MSGIVSDPSTLTKDKLKRELGKFDVNLPSPDAKKSVYVELYRQHVLNQTSEFSADEETSPKSRKKKIVTQKSSKKMAAVGVDVMNLSDAELSDKLKAMGVEMGPILPSTRKVYQKKLEKLLISGGEPAPIKSYSQDTLPVDDLDFSAESEPEEPPVVVSPPVAESVRRRQTRSSPPRQVAPPPSPPRQRSSKVVHTPPRQTVRVVPPSQTSTPMPRTPPKLPQDARPLPSKYRSYDQTDDSKTLPAGKVEKKRWMSVWLQIVLLLIVAAIIFFIIQNMEPASKDPLKGLERDIP